VTFWRISNHITLNGGGGLRASGRWHTRGRRVTYSAENPASALLEVLVHLEIDLGDVPVRFRYLEIEAPDTTSIEDMDMDVVGPGWQDDIASTREAGDEWLQSRRSALLRVPSVVVPATWNVLLNPQHKDAQAVRITNVHEHSFDARLV
jgi:RES domain-containing protein